MSEHDLKLDYLKQRPQTNVEKLRADLDQIETLVGKLRYLEADQAKKIPEAFDQVKESFRLVETSGIDLKGEQTQWETICLDFEKQTASFIRILGGREALLQLREAHSPSPENWWWYPDRLLSKQRRSLGVRAIFWLGLAGVLFVGFAWLYQRYLAPDEATQASLQHSFTAENLADQGDYQAAYDQVEKAIAAKPGQADLYLFKGVLADILGRPEIASQAFQQAEAGSPDRVTFLIARANEYLRFGQTQRAIEDAQAAVEQDSQQASAYLILGQAYESSGDYQNALDNYRKADKLATEQNDAQVQVITRISIGQLYNKLPALAPTDAVTPGP
jgi:tetratricopeptide (TPR) repeat protein